MTEIKKMTYWRSTSLQGYVDDGVTYADLVNVFGEPHELGSGDDKVAAEWAFEVDGEPATICNYKTGKNYLGDEGREVEELVGDDWHIGGNTTAVVLKLNNYIKEKK